jgi:large subunit ribosomal protein L10
MALLINDKKAIVAEVAELAKGAKSAVVADSRGVGAADMTALRKLCRDNNVDARIVRNSLLARAVEGTEYACLAETFTGPTLVAFAFDHPGAAARLFKEFAKTNKNFTIKGAAFEGEFISAEDIDRLATLPTYEEAIAHLMATMKEAAAGKLVRTLAALGDKLKEAA